MSIMKKFDCPIIFGPVPSRRLGQSLGIVNVFPKQCPYSCIYCQLGKTKYPQIIRNLFFSPNEIYEAVRRKLEQVHSSGLHIDYLTFVPTGEPALDENLGASIKLLKSFNMKIAIISNASMLTREDVKKDFLLADYVSLKIDALSYKTWLKINRPNTDLEFEKIITEIENFRRIYQGALVTETMFVKNVNDSTDEADLLADYISNINPDTAYIAVPIRPPAEKLVEIPHEADLVRLYQIFKKKINRVEYLINYEGNQITNTEKDVTKDILDITSVHPLRENAIRKILHQAKTDENLINELVVKNQIIKAHYLGETFYVRHSSN